MRIFASDCAVAAVVTYIAWRKTRGLPSNVPTVPTCSDSPVGTLFGLETRRNLRFSCYVSDMFRLFRPFSEREVARDPILRRPITTIPLDLSSKTVGTAGIVGTSLISLQLLVGTTLAEVGTGRNIAPTNRLTSSETASDLGRKFLGAAPAKTDHWPRYLVSIRRTGSELMLIGGRHAVHRHPVGASRSVHHNWPPHAEQKQPIDGSAAGSSHRFGRMRAAFSSPAIIVAWSWSKRVRCALPGSGNGDIGLSA